VRTGKDPISFADEITSWPNFESRSNTKKRCTEVYGQASRICCTTQRAFGFLVTLKRRILRRSWPMTKKQYSTPKVIVGTVKKSMAAIASRWFHRNVSQRLMGFKVLGASRSHRETVGSERTKPSLSSSP